jgi:hypothetical protein
MDEDEEDPLGRIRQLHPRIQRRRDLVASLNYPAELREKFGKFTDSELGALKIISDEVIRRGACTLTKDTIANLSCASIAVVKVASRSAPPRLMGSSRSSGPGAQHHHHLADVEGVAGPLRRCRHCS